MTRSRPAQPAPGAHASDGDLASYAEGELQGRRASELSAHLAGCLRCGSRLRELRDVTVLLGDVRFPPMPDRLAERISAAIASESAARAAGRTAVKPGRQEVPPVARRARRWRLARVSSSLTWRLVAAVGAAAIVAGGAYTLASQPGTAGAPTSAGPAQQSILTGGLQAGPVVRYTEAGHQHSITSVVSTADLTRTTLARQATDALSFVDRAGSAGPLAGTARRASSLPLETKGAAAAPANSPVAPLPGCVARIAADRIVLLIELATFQGKPATVIVVQVQVPGSADVYAVGAGCSATASDILAEQVMQLP